MAETVMVGRGKFPDCVGGRAGAVAAGTSLAGDDCGAGVTVTDVSAVGEGCGAGGSDVCAHAHTLREEIRNDVDASKRGRNDTRSPLSEKTDYASMRRSERPNNTR